MKNSLLGRILFYFTLKIKNIFKITFYKILIIFYRLKYFKLIKKKKLKKKQKENFLVIFGSSEELLKLSKKDKLFFKKSLNIFMNKNLIFWKKINFWPDYFFLSDTPLMSNKATRIFIDSLDIVMKSKKKKPIFLVENFYKYGVPKTVPKINFFFSKSKNLKWGENINDEMFGFHGSLTTLLNVISALNLSKKILLVGFDMNTKKYFFESDNRFKNYIDKTYHQNTNVHPNVFKVNKKNILSYWPIINKNLKRLNIEVYCSNKNSVLVKKKLVRYSSINNFFLN